MCSSIRGPKEQVSSHGRDSPFYQQSHAIVQSEVREAASSLLRAKSVSMGHIHPFDSGRDIVRQSRTAAVPCKVSGDLAHIVHARETDEALDLPMASQYCHHAQVCSCRLTDQNYLVGIATVFFTMLKCPLKDVFGILYHGWYRSEGIIAIVCGNYQDSSRYQSLCQESCPHFVPDHVGSARKKQYHRTFRSVLIWILLICFCAWVNIE